ncbi:hypothetical protein F503_07334 [Ophiostoma piceae UAMH 11346]|uniref:Uncharacterized protein n=1 Tax=Ophiostoma piceae (strain UAMH 11346) TaxID=1262450 RepID=S3CSD3_OPHP1|nr:hypothetical protein F503_07334 [Ophiostoma piceae UAMH 11346]
MGKLLPDVWPTLAANLSFMSFKVSLLLHKVGTSIATLNAHANPTDEVVFAASKATFFNSDESISMPHLQRWLRDLHQLRRQLMLLVHLLGRPAGTRARDDGATVCRLANTGSRGIYEVVFMATPH